MKTVLLFVNGILTQPGASRNWTGRAVTSTHINTDFKAEKIEYFSGVISRALFNTERARKMSRTLSFYQGWDIVIAGHSNGADVILDALQQSGWPKVKALHLISAACEADFEKNGLNAAKSVEKVTVWIGDHDWALNWADTVFGRMLGYGTLGKTGPVNAKRQVSIIERSWGHMDWFRGDHFPATMKLIWKDASS